MEDANAAVPATDAIAAGGAGAAGIAAPVFSLRGVSKFYGTGEAQVHALRDVSLAIGRGEFVVLLGASGSGKSTRPAWQGRYSRGLPRIRPSYDAAMPDFRCLGAARCLGPGTAPHAIQGPAGTGSQFTEVGSQCRSSAIRPRVPLAKWFRGGAGRRANRPGRPARELPTRLASHGLGVAGTRCVGPAREGAETRPPRRCRVGRRAASRQQGLVAIVEAGIQCV